MSGVQKQLRITLHLAALVLVVLAGVSLFRKVDQARHLTVDTVAPPVTTVDEKSGPVHVPPAVAKAGDQAILDRNLFGAMQQPMAQEVHQVDVEQLAQTTLDIALLGTIDGDDPAKRAVIKDNKARSQNIYGEGDRIDGALIKKIMRGNVVLQVGGRDEILVMDEGGSDEAGPPTAAAPAQRPPVAATPRPSLREPVSRPLVAAPFSRSRSVVVQQAVVDEFRKDPGTLGGGVKMLPHLSSGKPDGVVISQLDSGSLFRNLGLAEGDVLRTVNGTPVRSLVDVIALYSAALNSGKALSVEVNRRGRLEKVEYSFKE